MPKGTCPECDAEVQISADVMTGHIIECDDCGTELEVSGLGPVELDILDEDLNEDLDEEDDEY